jgi:aminopeptidase-like protein
MIGKDIHLFATELWKLNRSITGEGVRQTLSIIKTHLPDIKIKSIPSGTDVFDWTVPQEWHVNEAYITTPDGQRICEFSKNNLHLVGYSAPFKGTMSLADLQKHLHSLPGQPDAIPYITSYYEERWGFCLTQNERDKLKDGEYEINIDSSLFQGELNYAELILPGSVQEEVFVSTYICHPSMANNELSGPSVVTFLAKWLVEQKHRKYTYRIIFVPETIGSIAYLSLNYQQMKKNVKAGFNVTCVGDNRSYSYLPSRKGNTLSDSVAKHVLNWLDPNFIEYAWTDRGSDERQYCAPGIDLPVVSIMRTKYGEYPEYHTSLDDLINVVTPAGLNGGYWALRNSIEILEKNEKYKVKVFCEPQLGKRGLYPTLSTIKSNDKVKLVLNLISYCDGEHTLLQIADKIEVPCWEVYETLEKLKKHDLLTIC